MKAREKKERRAIAKALMKGSIGVYDGVKIHDDIIIKPKRKRRRKKHGG